MKFVENMLFKAQGLNKIKIDKKNLNSLYHIL